MRYEHAIVTTPSIKELLEALDDEERREATGAPPPPRAPIPEAAHNHGRMSPNMPPRTNARAEAHPPPPPPPARHATPLRPVPAAEPARRRNRPAILSAIAILPCALYLAAPVFGPARTPTVTEPAENAIAQRSVAVAAITPPALPRSIDDVRSETAKPDTADTQATLPATRLEALVERGRRLADGGDISGARLLLEHAADAGSAEAALRAGELFDPTVLTERGIVGLPGDTVRARAWYTRAQAMGAAEARDRLSRLPAD